MIVGSWVLPHSHLEAISFRKIQCWTFWIALDWLVIKMVVRRITNKKWERKVKFINNLLLCSPTFITKDPVKLTGKREVIEGKVIVFNSI